MTSWLAWMPCAATRWPGFTSVTFAPTSSTVPVLQYPVVRGKLGGFPGSPPWSQQ